jgi:hypothetical protein
METAKQSSTAGNAQFPNFIFTSANVLSFMIITAVCALCWQLFPNAFSNDVTLHQIIVLKKKQAFFSISFYFSPLFSASLFFIVGSCLARRDAEPG